MDLLTRMVEHHIWLAGEMIGRARRLAAAELDKPFEMPSPAGSTPVVWRFNLGSPPSWIGAT
jgi:hypothetical protein